MKGRCHRLRIRAHVTVVLSRMQAKCVMGIMEKKGFASLQAKKEMKNEMKIISVNAICILR